VRAHYLDARVSAVIIFDNPEDRIVYRAGFRRQVHSGFAVIHSVTPLLKYTTALITVKYIIARILKKSNQ